MLKFIRLTQIPEHTWINLNNVQMFNWSEEKDMTEIHFGEHDKCFVVETPEQIMEMINDRPNR